MYKCERHRIICSLLNKMNIGILQETNCCFAGGTAISLLTGEKRESLDIDFIISDASGYKKIRNMVYSNGLNDLFNNKIVLAREIIADRYGIRAQIKKEDHIIKFEIVSENRINIDPCEFMHPIKPPVLSKVDFFAEKLLANADRALDISTLNKDLFDIYFMLKAWGNIPEAAIKKAKDAYGEIIVKSFNSAIRMISDKKHTDDCINKMNIVDFKHIEAIKLLKKQLINLKQNNTKSISL